MDETKKMKSKFSIWVVDPGIFWALLCWIDL